MTSTQGVSRQLHRPLGSQGERIGTLLGDVNSTAHCLTETDQSKKFRFRDCKASIWTSIRGGRDMAGGGTSLSKVTIG